MAREDLAKIGGIVIVGVVVYYGLSEANKTIKSGTEYARVKAQSKKSSDIGTSTETAEAYSQYDDTRAKTCEKQARRQANKDWDAKGVLERGWYRAKGEKDDYINKRYKVHYKECMNSYSTV